MAIRYRHLGQRLSAFSIRSRSGSKRPTTSRRASYSHQLTSASAVTSWTSRLVTHQVRFSNRESHSSSTQPAPEHAYSSTAVADERRTALSGLVVACRPLCPLRRGASRRRHPATQRRTDRNPLRCIRILYRSPIATESRADSHAKRIYTTDAWPRRCLGWQQTRHTCAVDGEQRVEVVLEAGDSASRP
jgi:hypothetical protein